MDAEKTKAMLDGAREACHSLVEQASSELHRNDGFFPNGITRLKVRTTVSVGGDEVLGLELELEGPDASSAGSRSGRGPRVGGDIWMLQLTPTAIYRIELSGSSDPLHVVTVRHGYQDGQRTWRSETEHWFASSSHSDLAAALGQSSSLTLSVVHAPPKRDPEFENRAFQIDKDSHDPPVHCDLYPSSWKPNPRSVLTPGSDFVFGVASDQQLDPNKPCFAFRADPKNGGNLGRVLAIGDPSKLPWSASQYTLNQIAPGDWPPLLDPYEYYAP
ncbi:MAG TPA: hypothetical protein RMH99_03465 [Sandaracinaceae bacterium LLY-WYZ-13_1]|nr:hypothetical protein [Sandaracinaceae bacterium LLY-WYZ-13_1]